MLVGQKDKGWEPTTGLDKRMGTMMSPGVDERRGQKSGWSGLKSKWVGNEVDSIRVLYLRERLWWLCGNVKIETLSFCFFLSWDYLHHASIMMGKIQWGRIKDAEGRENNCKTNLSSRWIGEIGISAQVESLILVHRQFIHNRMEHRVYRLSGQPDFSYGKRWGSYRGNVIDKAGFCCC